MNSIVVLQARTNSSRLPGKVLLPIKEIPLVVLAAKRAANKGRSVIVVTSSDPSDDGLAALLSSYSLSCFRGSLENTLDRFVSALSAYDDESIIIRLTADNVFPDGELLDENENYFVGKQLHYLCCNGEHSGLPYGMSVEITRLVHLREAAKKTNSKYDIEHVTPYIVRKFGATYFQQYKHLKKGHFRCTIDCFDDYISIQKVFSDVLDPVNESSFDLLKRLEKAPFQPITSSSVSKLVFGTAQLGEQYGIANKTGQPDQIQSQELLKAAIINGVAYLDTARAYGSSEDVIGQSLINGWRGRTKIITKLSPMVDCPFNASTSSVHAFVDASVFKSCSALRVQKIDVLMLHRNTHLSAWNDAVLQRLLKLQSYGVIGELGTSVQNPEELLMALSYSEIHYIQLPCNLLDWRWDSIIPKVVAAKASRKLIVHVRSALLQGLLPSKVDDHWHRANVENPIHVKNWLKNQVNSCQRSNVTDLCISYVNSLPWVDGIVVGMENMAQLKENINHFTKKKLSNVEVQAIQNTRPKLNNTTLNPAFWIKENT
ncbi:MAG: hypothetical protein FDX21_10580 [Chlorobium sp.]|nr:MAG: hypothetical protein FDX21_10580 [Chlorobium sp.]